MSTGVSRSSSASSSTATNTTIAPNLGNQSQATLGTAVGNSNSNIAPVSNTGVSLITSGTGDKVEVHATESDFGAIQGGLQLASQALTSGFSQAQSVIDRTPISDTATTQKTMLYVVGFGLAAVVLVVMARKG